MYLLGDAALHIADDRHPEGVGRLSGVHLLDGQGPRDVQDLQEDLGLLEGHQREGGLRRDQSLRGNLPQSNI